MTRKVIRKCLVCGKKFNVEIDPKKWDKEGVYFGIIKFPVGKGKNVRVGEIKFGKHRFPVVKWTGKKKRVEYWECRSCFKSAKGKTRQLRGIK